MEDDWIKFRKHVRFCFFFWFFKNCELIKDSSLWRSNYIPSVRDSIIIIGSGLVTNTFVSHFNYKRWVRVSIKIWIVAFLGKYSNIICWVSKSVDWGSHHAVGIPSRMDEKKLNSLRGWYQILDDLKPRLATPGEWCCTPNLGVGIYEAYLLGGLRLPLNAFVGEILYRLGIGINQLNPNAWRLIIFMQV